MVILSYYYYMFFTQARIIIYNNVDNNYIAAIRCFGKRLHDREINLNPPLTLGQLPDTTEELLKLDQVSSQQLNELSQLEFK